MQSAGLSAKLSFAETDAATSIALKRTPVHESYVTVSGIDLSVKLNQNEPLGVFAFDDLVSSVSFTTGIAPMDEVRMPQLRRGAVDIRAPLQRAELSGHSIALGSTVNESLKLDLSSAETFRVWRPYGRQNVSVPVSTIAVPPRAGVLSFIELSMHTFATSDPGLGSLLKTTFCASSLRLSSRLQVKIVLDNIDVLPSGMPDTAYTSDMQSGLKCLMTRVSADATEYAEVHVELKQTMSDPYWPSKDVLIAWKDFFEGTFLQPLESLNPISAHVSLVNLPPGTRVVLDNVREFERLRVSYATKDTEVWYLALVSSQTNLHRTLQARRIGERTDRFRFGQQCHIYQRTRRPGALMANGHPSFDVRLCSVEFAMWDVDLATPTDGADICLLLATMFESFDDVLHVPDFKDETCNATYWTEFAQRTVNDLERRNCRAKFHSASGLVHTMSPTVSAKLFVRRSENEPYISLSLIRYYFDERRNEFTYKSIDSNIAGDLECRFTLHEPETGYLAQQVVPFNTSTRLCKVEFPLLSELVSAVDFSIDLRNSTADGEFALLSDIIDEYIVEDDSIIFAIPPYEIANWPYYSNRAPFLAPFDDVLHVIKEAMSPALLQALEVDVHLPGGSIVTLQPEQYETFAGRFCFYQLLSRHGLDLTGSHESLCDTNTGGNKLVLHMPNLHELSTLSGGAVDVPVTSAVTHLHVVCPERPRYEIPVVFEPTTTPGCSWR
ncbi:MAG: hypothetical protein MHM6MM_005511 [Cercozoa sp. M6MM]